MSGYNVSSIHWHCAKSIEFYGSKKTYFCQALVSSGQEGNIQLVHKVLEVYALIPWIKNLRTFINVDSLAQTNSVLFFSTELKDIFVYRPSRYPLGCLSFIQGVLNEVLPSPHESDIYS